MKIGCWNVNGLRACAKKNFWQWFNKEKFDIVCLQEVKADPNDLDSSIKNPKNYSSFFFPALKKGYSGVGLYIADALKEKVEVINGISNDEFDSEGRVISIHFPDLVIYNIYFPNGGEGNKRVPFKMDFCHYLQKYLLKEKKKNKKEIIVCGDFNTAHQEIDLKNPKENQESTGFLPIEREWIDSFIKNGFTDCFRHFHPNQRDKYTYWSYRTRARERNAGWRLDYFFATKGILSKVEECEHQDTVEGSDHCPIKLKIK